MSLEKDRAFFRNFSIVVIILAVMMIVFGIAAHVVGGAISYGGSARTEQIAERTAPVGEVRMEGEAQAMAEAATDGGEQAAAGPKSGKEVYDSVCIACHSGALPGAPATGNAGDWAPRLDKGMDTLYQNAIDGFQGEGGMMPARGGNSALSDAEVKAAVDYMVENSK